MIRNFLESDEEFFAPESGDFLLTRYEKPFLGFDLPDEVLSKIYFRNFQRVWGRKPLDANWDEAIKRFEEKGERSILKVLERQN